MSRYVALVRQYSSALDLSSPGVLADFELAIQHTETYDAFLDLGCRVLDLGSGVGLPGIPLAIRRPDLEITLCEIRKRRAAFLERAVSTLRLKNARVYNGNVQQLREGPFDVVIAQAVGRLKQVYGLCRHALKPSWTLLARKGVTLEDELEELGGLIAVPRVGKLLLEDGTMLVAVHGGNA